MSELTTSARYARKARLARLARKAAVARIVANYEAMYRAGEISAEALSHRFAALAGC